MNEKPTFEYPKPGDGSTPLGTQIDLSKDPDELRRPMNFKEKSKYFTFRGLVLGVGRLAAVMPEKSTYKFCERLMMLFHKKGHKFRNLARKHVDIAFGNEKTPEEIDEIVRQTYINYSKNLAEFLMIPHKSQEWIENKVNFNDPNWNTRTALNAGKGVIGLGGHFGSWELVAARLGIYKYPMVVIVKAQRDAFISQFIMETRTKWGNEYIFRVKGVKAECFRQLKQNKILALMADQNATRSEIFVDFFGKKAATVPGPAFIAMKSGAPIVPSYPARNPDGTITLHVMEPIKLQDTGNFEQDLIHNTQLCSNSVEDFARKHPTEYFWWHRRWKKRPEKNKESHKQK